MKKMKKQKNRGITLIALVITIIVLLILAGVTISTLTGENGILTKAITAKEQTRAAEVEEQVNLWKTEKEAGNYTNTSVKSESELLEEMKEAGILFEEEIDRENQIITIDNKTIYYGEGKPLTDIYVALYNDGTLVFNSKDEFDTSKIVENGHFGNIKGEHYYYDWDIYEGVTPPWTENEFVSQITQVEFVNEIVPKYTSCWFFHCDNITSLDLSKLDTSNVTDMSSMFYRCENLTNLSINKLDTSNVTDMNYMFSSCYALTSLDLSNFNTSNVTNMSNMFYYCSKLTNLNVSSFDTSHVTNMEMMFGTCVVLTNLDLSNFDTNAVQNYSYMFLNDSNTQVYIGENWNSAMTESATNYSKTFIKK